MQDIYIKSFHEPDWWECPGDGLYQWRSPGDYIAAIHRTEDRIVGLVRVFPARDPEGEALTPELIREVSGSVARVYGVEAQ